MKKSKIPFGIYLIMGTGIGITVGFVLGNPEIGMATGAIIGIIKGCVFSNLKSCK